MLGYHYIVNMDTNVSIASMKYASTYQNLQWIKANECCRVEYIGGSGDNVKGLTEDLLVTGLFSQICEIREFEKILSEFLNNLELEYYRDYETQLISFYQVTIDDVKSYYQDLKGTRDADWFLEFDSTLEVSFGDIKKMYYDFHLEDLLYRGLREEYEEYIARTTTKTSLSNTHRKSIKNIDTKALVVGAYHDFLPKRIDGSDIIYGKYHVSLHQSNAIIPPYSRRTPGLRTHIMSFAFDGCDNLESVLILDDIFDFGNFVFRGCTNLKKVTLNNNIEVIPCNTFLNCVSLETVDIPQSIKVIENHAFHGCHALSDANLFSHTHLEKIGEGAFIGCRDLKNIKLPETIFEIDDFAFAESGLENIEIPSTVHSIGYSAFEDCKRLKWVIFPKEATEVPFHCFSGCTELESIILNEGITKIDDSAFSRCRKLREIIIPEGVSKIGENAFEDCTNLGLIRLNKGIIEIGDSAFSGCHRLEEIVIPDGVEKIGHGIFDGCINLTSVSFPESITHMGDCSLGKCTILYCKRNSFIHRKAIEEEWNYHLV